MQDQIIFARHLSIMAQAGMSILDSLALLKKQARTSAMRTILEGVTREVSNGQFLSVAMEPYTDIFGELFINIIHIGETSGTLSENLKYLSEELTKRRELKSKVTSALVYPFIILFGVAAIIAFLVFFIFPKILPVFATLNFKLPLSTRILIAFADIATKYTLVVIIAVLGLAASGWLSAQVAKIRYFYHRVVLFIPVVGSISTNVNMANLCRTLGILLKSGVKIVEALSVTATTVENLVYRKHLIAAADKVRKGGEISSYLSLYPRLFPAMLSQMVNVGESTGNLSETLIYLADFYEEGVDNATKNLATVLEPLLLIVMGGIVGFVAIAVITPIYGITQNIHG